MFGTIDKIEKSLYTPCKFLTIKNVVNLSISGDNDRRLDSVYAKTYSSKKYGMDLTTLSLKVSEFLVFSYSRDKTFEEVYVSYPHLEKIIEGFSVMRDALSNADLFIESPSSGLSINADHSHFSVKIKGLASGKSILLVPDVVDDKENGEMEGVTLYIGNEENMVQMNHEAFSSLTHFLINFNLQTTSQMLINLAAMYKLNTLINSEQGKSSSSSSNLTIKQPKKERKIASKNETSQIEVSLNTSSEKNTPEEPVPFYISTIPEEKAKEDKEWETHILKGKSVSKKVSVINVNAIVNESRKIDASTLFDDNDE